METSPRTDESPHLTVDALALRWHTTPNAIYVRRHRRQLPPAIRRGRKLLWPQAAIEEFEAEERANDPQNPANDPALVPVQKRRKAPTA